MPLKTRLGEVKDLRPLGIRNNNPLNIRINRNNHWQGKDEPSRHDEFETFQNPVMGLRAGAVLIINHYDNKGADTIRKLIMVWAPPKGRSGKGKAYTQDTNAYIQRVSAGSGFGPDEPLDFHTYDHLAPVMVEMIAVENGMPSPYPEEMLDQALTLAGVQAGLVPIGQTRTMRGAKIASVGLGGSGLSYVTQFLSDYWQEFQPYIGMISYIGAGTLVLTLMGIGIVVFARHADRKAGIR